MAETPLGIPYPEAGDHTRLWEHFQALADSVDARLAAMTTVVTNYTNVKHDFLASGTNSGLSPGWSFTATNPLDVPQVLRVDVGGLVYGTTASADLCYYRPRVTGAGVSALADPEGRLDFPDGDSGTIYLQLANWGLWRVPASTEATVELTGRQNGSATGQWYVQFATMAAAWQGPTT